MENKNEDKISKLIQESLDILELELGDSDPINSYESVEEMYQDYPLIKLFHKLLKLKESTKIKDDDKCKAIKFAMDQLVEVRTGGDFEVVCHNAGVLLGHAFGIYLEDTDKDHAQDLIDMNYPDCLEE